MKNEANDDMRFSTEDDSIKNIVLDYNVLQYLNERGYYENGTLKEYMGTAPIYQAVKYAESVMDSVNNRLLYGLLEKRLIK